MKARASAPSFLLSLYGANPLRPPLSLILLQPICTPLSFPLSLSLRALTIPPTLPQKSQSSHCLRPSHLPCSHHENSPSTPSRYPPRQLGQPFLILFLVSRIHPSPSPPLPFPFPLLLAINTTPLKPSNPRLLPQHRNLHLALLLNIPALLCFIPDNYTYSQGRCWRGE